jgi:hypothetical protein
MPWFLRWTAQSKFLGGSSITFLPKWLRESFALGALSMRISMAEGALGPGDGGTLLARRLFTRRKVLHSR